MSAGAPRLLALLSCWTVVLGAERAAAQERTTPPAQEESAPAECYPACRAGFVCHQGQCVSECNPPCPQGQACVQGQYCEPRAPGAAGDGGVYEPPPPPPPPSFDRRTHSGVAFHMGFGGGAKANGVRQDLASTLGVNVRTDVPVAKYILLGPLFQFGAWRPDMPNPPDRNFYFDIDFFARARVPIQTESVAFQVWLGLPIGLTLDFLGDRYNPELDGFAFGYNYGFLFGGAVHFSKKFGMFAELGWMSHRMSHDRANAGGSVDIRISQTVANFGFMFGG